MPTGTLYLIPVPLGQADPEACLPRETLYIARRLNAFIVEHGKTARTHLKAMGHPKPLQQLAFYELNEHTRAADIPALLAPLKHGIDVGLMSDAGCPAVADPGSMLIRVAHQENIPVVPLIGPSSILLALMASGLSGQQFCFHGYLPVKEPERIRKIRELEHAARSYAVTQLFIETPYRSAALLEVLSSTLSASVRVSIAANLGLPGQYIRTMTAEKWRGKGAEIKDRLTVFGIGM